MTFGTLFLIVVAGLCGPLLSGFRRFPMPATMGQLGAGILIGTSGFKLLDTNDPVLVFLSSIGLAMLMFLIGTGLPLQNQELKSVLRESIKAALLAFAIAIPFAFLLGYINTGSSSDIPWFIILLACSSTAVVMPMVKERGLEGKIVLLTCTWVAVADITAVVSLPLAVYHDKVLTVIAGALAITAAAAACLWGLRFFRDSKIGRHYRKLSKVRGWALDLRLSICILFALTWMALQFGTSVLVSGFAAGAVVAMIGQPRRFTKQLIGLAEGFFVPLFFVDLGAKLDFTGLFQSWHFLVLMASIVVASVAVHVIVAKIIGLPWASGLMASSQQGLPIALVSIGLSEHILQPGQGAAIIAAATALVAVASFGTLRLSKLVPCKNCVVEESNQEASDLESDEDDALDD